ncbi:endonuclease domain-containing protein [Methylocystis sp. 9N]|uniref:Endonuclease domain-containing protein n=1 Tax=Methylocystis borbori TaxID=3118750 RepID=A0ABU7XJY4_9HYPH
MNDKTDRSDPRTPRARRLRREATPAERNLWTQLRQLEIGAVPRQDPIGPYFADFACHRTRIVVEIDGAQHGFDDERLRDEKRTRFLETTGYPVLRFWNHEVLRDLESVVDTICAALYQALEPPTPSPSPPQAGGGE